MQRELRVNSYTQVVRHGSLEEKRNLLRRLAQLGTPRHLAIVRQFLGESEPELRLCAYAELARIAQRHEHRIGELRRQTLPPDATDNVAPRFAALAAAARDYATSGSLDVEMARYWAEQSEIAAKEALALDASCMEAQRTLALLLGDRGDLAGASALVAAWPEEVDDATDLVRAEIAFRRRDRSVCQAVLLRLDARRAAVPEWLRSVATVGADGGARRKLQPRALAPRPPEVLA